tara:strand:- start:5042 stop:5470 length:429 start_codon:yes stop_codon:yes gene_type:complete
MVETRQPIDNNEIEVTQNKNVTPETITTTMILEDLNSGVDRNGIKDKYDLETWEVTQMFQHPALKGKKAKKIRKLSFNFVDDTPQEVTFEEAIAAESNPNQLDLEDAIADELQGRVEMDAQDQANEMDHLESKADDFNERGY